MSTKIALISGVTGQDGSYLAEYLLDLGYVVHGIVRRTSSPNLARIAHLLERIKLHQADMLDQASLQTVVREVRPTEVYNLAAQSFVHTSWRQPILTAEVTGVGATRLLEAVRLEKPDASCYQASSSEMFGKVQEEPQTERTPFYPRSPYGVAKVYAHWITINYRESYDLRACCGILYNHETNTPATPILIRRGNKINVCPLGELAPSEAWRVATPDFEVWDNSKWVKATAISRYCEPNKPITRLLARAGYVECTNDHVICGNGGDKAIENFVVGEQVSPPILPAANEAPRYAKVPKALAWLLGFFVGDGSLHGGGSGVRSRGRLEFFNADIDKLRCVEANIKVVDHNAEAVYLPHPSTYKPGNVNHKLHVISSVLKEAFAGCYWETRPKALKRVPQIILNADLESIEAFLDGYADADGTKSLPRARYKFQYYTTKSQALALGLRLLCHWTGRHVTNNCERRENHSAVAYYHKGMIRSRRDEGRDGQRGRSGFNLLRDPLEIRKIWHESASEFITLTTESGTFSAGTGLLKIHNSPRRGPEFVTRKIAIGAARIARGLDTELVLGNLDAKRDWGHARDYVRAMHLMLQRNKVDDYVIATGIGHSVREFCQAAFDHVGLEYEKYVKTSPEFYRPAEVNTLLGDASKARYELPWCPHISFGGLVKDMVDHEMLNLLKAGGS